MWTRVTNLTTSKTYYSLQQTCIDPHFELVTILGLGNTDERVRTVITILEKKKHERSQVKDRLQACCLRTNVVPRYIVFG